ncbi:hypothetical protein ES711_10525 [Gelidibacter salicanalis]|uniref:Baseplate assembly protein n=1 Tax=Gelidibacter salicanalis TaxID=291193 RepID=A0A5C7AH32_9FLAO|nr:hypothetical protein [Gelidibacter salicanalis]TXE07858.1 hypothetical protein ES711_10525 [Gelidibacter salicanalis]
MKHTNCGCCAGIQLRSPIKIINRAGLSAIDYRIGDYNDFKASLLSKLTVSQLETLKKLTTRSDDDFTIALIDAFSILSDVLTFYQERIVNESYLRTATERLSVAELAAMIGYELNPGVAATTYLSFTLDESSMQPGAESIRKIRVSGNENPIVNMVEGVKAQSVPEQDEEPQVFETVEDIDAKSDWNSMLVKSFVEQENLASSSIIYINGINNNIKKGDQILIVEGGNKKVRKVNKVDLLKDIDTTEIFFTNLPLLTAYLPVFQWFPMVAYYAEPFALSSGTVSGIIGPLNKVSSYELQSALTIQNWSPYEFKTSVNSSKPVQNSEIKVYVFRNRAALFGYNAPKKITNIAANGNVTTTEHVIAETINEITLDAEYVEITSGDDGYIALKKPGDSEFTTYKISSSELVPQTKYGISGKSTKIKLEGSPAWSLSNMAQLRSSIAYNQSEKLGIALKPITSPLEKGTTKIVLSKFYVDLKVNQKILISGEVNDWPGVIRTEIHTIQEVALVDKYTQIITEKGLENSFVRNTVRINANVALATHGETVSEVLGSGDARMFFQKFELKHIPVTYVADNSASGSSSSIAIRVNDILWKEVPYFYGRQPDDHVFTVRRSNEGKTTIRFGDGVHGSRLPTGKLNIRAVYRKGIGSSGLLKSNQISQLISKPLYLKTVNNPVAPEGAQNPEEIEDARRNANLSIHTLDRIVSLKDYENFAKSFAGIDKAKSVWLWSQGGKIVHLTVAGANGSEIEENSKLFDNLSGAIQKFSYPGVQLHIQSFRKRYFRIVGNLNVGEDYVFQKVHDQIVEKLRNAYSYKNSQIGKNIHLSEVISIIESTEGVNYIDIDQLFITGGVEKLEKVLIAQIINASNTTITASELIMLDPSPFTFNEI